MEQFVYQYSSTNQGHNQLFCTDTDGNTTLLIVRDLPQYLYLELPTKIAWEKSEVSDFISNIVSIIANKVCENRNAKGNKKYETRIPPYIIVRKRKIYGAHLQEDKGRRYNNAEMLKDNEIIICNEDNIYPQNVKENMGKLNLKYGLFPFLRFEFNNSFELLAFRKAIDEIQTLSIDGKEYNLKHHASNIDASMRLMNQCDLPSYGWIKVDDYCLLENTKLLTVNPNASINELNAYNDTVKKYKYNNNINPSRCNTAYEVSYKALHKANRDQIPNIVMATYDIENNVTGTEKNAYRAENAIFAISIVFYDKAKPNLFIKHLHMIRGNLPRVLKGNDYLGDIVNIEDAVLHEDYSKTWLYEGSTAAEEESNLLKGFIEDLINMKTNIMIGFNSNSYDIDYIYKRCEYLNLKGELAKLSYINYEDTVEEKKTNLSTSARGFNEFYELSLKGIAMLDVLQYFKAEHRFPEYKLKYIAKEILKDKKLEKDPVDLATLCRAYNERSEELLNIVGKYNIQDSFVTLKLFLECNVLEFISELANITRIPIEAVYLYGQQKRIRSLIYFYCLRHNHIYENTHYIEMCHDHYAGAINLQPEIGDYFDTFIFDFASLYPSIIQAKNFDYSTYANDDLQILQTRSKTLPEAPSNKYSELKDEENLGSLCHVIHVNEHQRCIHTEGKSEEKYDKSVLFDGSIFICTDTRENFLKQEIFGMGIMPSMVTEFINKRRETKKEKEKVDEKLHNLKEEKEPDENLMRVLKHKSVILDKKQLALKVCANSIYGATGSGDHGSFPFVQVARSITLVGRKNIMTAKHYMEEHGGIDVIYGDTDSILCVHRDNKRLIKGDDGKYDVESFFKECAELEEKVNKNFEQPMRMEFEGVVYHYILFTAKKHYVTLLLGKDGKIDKPKEKGVLSVRRDICQYAKDVFKEIYLAAMTQDFEKYNYKEEARMKLNRMLDIYMNAILKMYRLDVNKDDLTISKTLKEKYQSKPVHSFVAERMRLRGEDISFGDRVKYVLTRGSILSNGASKKQADIADSYQHKLKWGEYIQFDHLALHGSQFVSQFDQIFDVIAKRAGINGGICESIYGAAYFKAKMIDQLRMTFSPDIFIVDT